MGNWFYQRNGEQKGPLSADKILQLYHVGILNADTRVWKQGTAHWTSLGHSELLSGTSSVAGNVRSSATRGKEAKIAIVVVLVVAGIVGAVLWNNTHSLSGAWQGKNMWGVTWTLDFRPGAQVAGGKMDLLYMRNSLDDTASNYYYVVTPMANNVYQIDYCGYSLDAGTIDEANEKQFTITLNVDGSATVDGFSGFSSFSRMDDARARAYLDIN